MTMKATKRLIDSVWTLECKELPNDRVRVLHYSRHDAEGYEKESELPKLRTILDKERNLLAVEIDGWTYAVINQKHIFDYGRPTAK